MERRLQNDYAFVAIVIQGLRGFGCPGGTLGSAAPLRAWHGAGNNSHFRQRPVIFGGYLGACAADLRGLPWARRDNQEELIMTDEDLGFAAAGQAWMAWPTEIGQNAVAVIARTRDEWASRASVSSSPDEIEDDGTRFARPLFRLAPAGSNQ